MIRDAYVLNQWIRVVAIVAALCSVSVPITYAFSRWYKSRIGQLFMLQSVVFSAGTWLVAGFLFWVPKNNVVVFITVIVVLALISFATAAMSLLICIINYQPKSSQRRGRHAHANE